jgi:hypothetical protein
LAKIRLPGLKGSWMMMDMDINIRLFDIIGVMEITMIETDKPIKYRLNQF